MVVALPEETFLHKGRRWHRIPEQPYQRFVMGVDLGQSQDNTAIAVIDHTRTPLGRLGRKRRQRQHQTEV